MRPPDQTSLKSWLPVVGLGFSAFIFVTSELLPIGLLSDIAQSLDKTEAATGLLLAVYAWVVALMSLPLTVLSARCNRRTLILVLLLVFIIGNLFSAMADTFLTLMAARLCIAFAHAIFWSITAPLAARIVPEHARSRAISVIVVGSSLATILGVPIGTLLGHHLGWRFAFASVAMTAGVVLIFMWRLLPSIASENTGSFSSLPDMLKNKSLLMIYLLTATVITGHFTFFTYFSPFMQQIGGFSQKIVAILLLSLGLSGVVGSIVGSLLADRPGKWPLLLPLSVLCGLLLIIPTVVRAGLICAALLCFLWGVFFTLATMTFQLRVLSYAPRARDVATSAYSGIFNIGIGGGALVGSWVFTHMGIVATSYVGAAFIGLAVLMILFFLSAEK